MSQTQKEASSSSGSTEIENVNNKPSTSGGNEGGENVKYRIMKIIRTYVDEETGQEYTKIEIVKKQVLIDSYVSIKTSKDDQFIRRAFNLDDIEKEKLRREKKRIQEQLRKVKQLDPERKVRKYNKTGLNRKANKLAKLNNDESLLNSSPETSNLMLKKFKSFDDKTQDGANNNIRLTGGAPQVVTKRKYVKRKKSNMDQSNQNNDSTLAQNSSLLNQSVEPGELTKLEGTKLIIKKKAISMAQAVSFF
jgi:hypothetical protein